LRGSGFAPLYVSVLTTWSRSFVVICRWGEWERGKGRVRGGACVSV
jgi:hypothetical protein